MLGTIAIAACLVVVLFVAWLTVRQRPSSPSSPEVLGTSSIPTLPALPAGLDSTPPSYDGPQNVVRAISPRENRERVLSDRREAGVCRYCDDPATHASPEILAVGSFFDTVYRYLSVVPMTRWRVSTTTSELMELCGSHQEMVRGRQQQRIQDAQTDYVAFTEKQRLEMYEFQRHALDERIVEDMNTIRQKRRGKTKVAVLQMADKKASG